MSSDASLPDEIDALKAMIAERNAIMIRLQDSIRTELPKLLFQLAGQDRGNTFILLPKMCIRTTT